MDIDVNIKLVNKYAKVPTKGSKYAAGYDLYNAGKVQRIEPHETVKIDTGVVIELPPGTFGGIFARSGLATKQGLRPANCTGVIDSDYRGNIIVALHNDTDKVQIINNGDRIAQLIILPFVTANFNVVDELSDTERGAGSFGSTGVK